MNEEIRDGEQLLREFDAYEPVHVAFWMRKSDEDERYLYIASDRIDSGNIDVAYSKALRVAQKLGSPYLNPFRMKLINSSAQLARAAIVERDRFPAPLPTRLGGRSFGGVDVADVYIYPAFDHAATP